MSRFHIAVFFVVLLHSCSHEPFYSLSVSENIPTCSQPILTANKKGTCPIASIGLIDSIPDYYQRDRAFGGFPRNGVVYCGPVAVSNSLMWLSQKGYGNLTLQSGDKEKDQHALIKKLGSPDFINTRNGGSSANQICNGVYSYLHQCGYKNAQIKYRGWRLVRYRFYDGTEVPTMEWIKKVISENNGVWLNIGWYRYNKKNDTYTREGGHWVTLVGYGHDNKGSNPNALIIHDPDTRHRFNEYIVPEKIGRGKIDGNFRGLPRNAKGYLRYQATRSQFGIIDGAIVLDMSLCRPDRDNISAQAKQHLY